MEIITVRHGKTAFTEKDVFEGCFNKNPLTKEGVRYSKELGAFLKDYGITAIFSSPLARAMETAKHISSITKLPVQTEQLLTEICYGSWEGKTKSRLKGTREWKDREADKYNYTHPGKNPEGKPGESYSDAEKRIRALLKKLNKESGKIALVCHIGIVRVARRIIEKIREKEAADFWLSPDEIYIVKMNGETKAGIVKFRQSSI